MIELAIDLWMFGVPVVFIAWAGLRMIRGARLRYLCAIAAFFAVLAPAFIRPEGTLHLPRVAVMSVVPRLWIAGTILLLIREAIGHVLLRRTRGTRVRALPGWPAHVPLFLSSTGPFTAGLLRPYVVLPGGDVDRRIALHELAHARWRDPLVYAVLRIFAAIFWVAPVWPLLRWIRREREAAADEAALRGDAGEGERYIATLLRMARRENELATAMAGSDLEYRARCVLTAPPPRFAAVTLLVLALGVSLLAIAQPVELPAKRIVEVIR